MDNWQKLFELDVRVKAIKSKSRRFIEKIQKVLDEDSNEGLSTTLVPSTGQEITANISTPVGDARMRLDWLLQSTMELVGVLVVERKRHDGYGKEFWEEVLNIYVPREDYPYIERDAVRVEWVLGDISAKSFDDICLGAAVYIVYHIASGK